MHKKTIKASKLVAVLAIAVMVLTAFPATIFAAGYEDLEPGVYTVDVDFSAYVTAMGGVEFGRPLVSGATVEVDENGDALLTLAFGKSSVTIYGVTANTFIDATPSGAGNSRGVPDGTLGIYDETGTVLQTAGVSYTLNDGTAENPFQEQVQYVDSVTFPLSYASDTYKLAIYINSHVMGVQFCQPNAQASSTTYSATLTVDWDSAEAVRIADETSNQSANVVYEVTGGYEVKIPATINVDSASKEGAYEVEAKNFVVPDGSYVTVSADGSGTLSNGSATLPFTNVLESGTLKATGDKLEGTVTVTGNPTSAGTYNGTIDFLISYFAG
jgi:hypothetical protein